MTRPLIAFCCLATAAFAQAPPLKPGLYAILDTSEGTITALLYDKYVPIAVQTFVGVATGSKPWRDPKTHEWVKRPMYTNILFHRVLRDEMIQTGDPSGTGKHDCGYTLRDEFLPGLQFDRPGRLAIANSGAPNSGGCQFFITDQAVPRWNNSYTVFGQVVAGMDVEHRINRKQLRGDRPVEPVILKRVTIQRILK